MPGCGVVLTHADPTVTPGIDDAVGISQCAFRSDRYGFGPDIIQTVDPLVLVIREIKGALRCDPCSATVLMHSGSCIERLGNHVLTPRALGCIANHNAASG